MTEQRAFVYKRGVCGDMTARWLEYPTNRVPFIDGYNVIVTNAKKPETPLNPAHLPFVDVYEVPRDGRG
jgi:hypothetical protein